MSITETETTDLIEGAHSERVSDAAAVVARLQEMGPRGIGALPAETLRQLFRSPHETIRESVREAYWRTLDAEPGPIPT